MSLIIGGKNHLTTKKDQLLFTLIAVVGISLPCC